MQNLSSHCNLNLLLAQDSNYSEHRDLKLKSFFGRQNLLSNKKKNSSSVYKSKAQKMGEEKINVHKARECILFTQQTV